MRSRILGRWHGGAVIRRSGRLRDKTPGRAEEVIPEFVAWLEGLPGDHLVAVGAPAAVDFSFVNYYCHRFAGRNPLGYACLDLLSFAMGRLGASDYWELEYTLENALNVERDPMLEQHVALDDAIQQARVLVALLTRAP